MNRRGFLRAFVAIAGAAAVPLPVFAKAPPPLSPVVRGMTLSTTVALRLLNGFGLPPIEWLRVFDTRGNTVEMFETPAELWVEDGLSRTLKGPLQFEATRTCTVWGIELGNSDGWMARSFDCFNSQAVVTGDRCDIVGAGVSIT